MEKIISLYIKEKSEKYGVENAHDKLFKNLLDDAEELKTFITKFIGIDIQDEQIEKCNHEYISNKYELYQSDMLYKIKGKDIYFLIEHQSTTDTNMSYRMLNYYIESLKEIMKNKEFTQYPLIIPIVLYTGERKWNVEQEYSQKIKEYKIKNKYIKLAYEVIDINKFTEDELLKKDTIIAYAMLIEKNRGKESLVSVLEQISNVCDTNKNKRKMQSIINYILYPILQEDTEKIMKKFKLKEEGNMKTAQDYIREEIRELKRKATEEGLAEGKKIIIINMIKNKAKIEEIKKYTGIDDKEIQEIVANM